MGIKELQWEFCCFTLLPLYTFALQVANILLNGVQYDSKLSDNTEVIDNQMSLRLLCIAIYRMPPSLRSLCTNHFLGKPKQ